MKLHPLVLCFILILPATAQERSAPAVLTASGGRFVFGQISSLARDQFMLDTQTGRLWQLTVDREGKPSLQPVPYSSTIGELHLEPPTAQREHAEIAAKLRELAATNAAAITQKYFGTNQPPAKLDLEPKKPDEKK
jgi:hypothetical protein